MGASITFNVDKLIKKLDIIQKSHLPKASEQALKSLGFDLREVLQKEMQREYESPNAFTLNSPSQLRMRDGDYVMVLNRETLVMQRSYAGSPLKDKTCKVVDGPRVRTQI